MKLEPGMKVYHRGHDGRTGVLIQKHMYGSKEFWTLDITHPDGTVFKSGSWFTHNIIPFPSTSTNKQAAKVLLSEEW